MCKSKKSTEAIEPQPPSSARHRSGATTSSSGPANSSSTASATSAASISSIRSSLSSNQPLIFSYSELSSAPRRPLSSTSWRTTLSGRDVAVVQRPLRLPLPPNDLPPLLSSLCRAHHSSVADLLGVSLSPSHAFLVYPFVSGATLSRSLRNPSNPSFTPLSTWSSRILIASDLAHGLHYIHHHLRLVHNHLSSSSVLVSDPDLRPKICLFGAAQIAGEIPPAGSSASPFIQGKRGYLAPETLASGAVTQKSDVYAFGVIVLELISGEDPVKSGRGRGEFGVEKVRLTERAAEVAAGGGAGLRRWVDGRLRDSFPVEVAERLTRVALECAHVDPDRRPEMECVAGTLSRLYLESEQWAETMRAPTEFSVSMAPR